MGDSNRGGGSTMFRGLCHDAVLLAFGLLVGELLDASGASGLFLGRASAQGSHRDEIKVDVREESMISEKPLTVSMRERFTPHLRSQIAEAIKGYPRATVRLTLGGVIPP